MPFTEDDFVGGLAKGGAAGGESRVSAPCHYLAVFCYPKHELAVFYGR